MIEFLGEALLVMVELFPYGAIGVLGYAWGADNEIKHKQEYAKQYANQRAVEELERLISYYEIAVEGKIKDRIQELKQE